MNLRTRSLSENLGTEVLDIDLADIDETIFVTIREAWQKDPFFFSAGKV